MYVGLQQWTHGSCAVVKMVTPTFSRNATCRNSKGNIGEVVEQEENLCDEEESVRAFTYLGDRVSAGGGCEVAVMAGQDVSGLSLGSVLSCCMAGDIIYINLKSCS